MQMSVKKDTAVSLVVIALLAISLITPLTSINVGVAAAKQSDPLSGDIVTLGKAIFFDTRLSKPVGQSCASCHDPSSGFADPNSDLPVSRGAIQTRFGNRNAQSAAYAMYSPELHFDPSMRPGIMGGMYVGGLFWDGRVDSLEEQAQGPFLNPLEMHNPDKKTVVLAVRQSEYAGLFKEVFGEDAFSDVDTAYDYIAQAIAAYERSAEVNPFTSKYDYWVRGEAEFTESELRGYNLFTSRGMMGAKCINCHAISEDSGGMQGSGGMGSGGMMPSTSSPSLFTSFGYQNLGVPRNPELPYYSLPSPLNPDGEDYVDLGLGDFLRQIGLPEEEAAMEDGKFKIPSLRNCAITAPYEHNGVFKTLKEVVMFNNMRDVPEAGYPPPEVPQNVHRHMGNMPRTFGRLGLTEQQVDDIVAFLQTLTDGYTP